MEEKRKNIFKFELIDNTNLDEFNESCKVEKSWYGHKEHGEVLDIESYFYMCREFAMAMGFGEKTVDEWFEC